MFNAITTDTTYSFYVGCVFCICFFVAPRTVGVTLVVTFFAERYSVCVVICFLPVNAFTTLVTCGLQFVCTVGTEPPLIYFLEVGHWAFFVAPYSLTHDPFRVVTRWASPCSLPFMPVIFFGG